MKVLNIFFVLYKKYYQKTEILIWMLFLNDIIESQHSFEAAQKFQEF